MFNKILPLNTTYLNEPTKVYTILDFWGGAGYVSVLDTIYEIQRFDDSDPPILIVHGTDDIVVHYSVAEELRDIYENINVHYEFYPLSGYGHGHWNAKVNGKSLSDLAFDFIVKQ